MKVQILLALVVVALNVGSSHPKTCHSIRCSVFCKNGYAKDENGCFECKCKRNLEPCADAPMCMMYCKNGFRRGLDGCFECKCNANLDHCKNRAMCKMYCENGFQRGMDGCEICKCA